MLKAAVRFVRPRDNSSISELFSLDPSLRIRWCASRGGVVTGGDVESVVNLGAVDINFSEQWDAREFVFRVEFQNHRLPVPTRVYGMGMEVGGPESVGKFG